MEYISYTDLTRDIRNNISKIPKDVDGVIGIPRSGMLPATIIAEYLNVGLTTLLNFVEKYKDEIENGYKAIFNEHGNRRLNNNSYKKILVVDDTCFNGKSILTTKKLLTKYKNVEFVYLVVYFEGSGTLSKPDVYLKDVRDLASKSEIGIVLYEWNLLSNPGIVSKTLFDLDGVFCVDPPDERNTEQYIEYLNNPIPLFVPSKNEMITILTYRLIKYKDVTIEFLKKLGLKRIKLLMFQAETYEERSKVEPWLFKGSYYKSNNDYKLFVESDDLQARMINKISGKPVFCVSTNIMYK